MRIYSSEEIIEHLKALTGDKFDSDLARRLDIDKQSIPQYKRKKNADIQLKIISLLLNKIEEGR